MRSLLAARSFFRDPVGYVRAHGDGQPTLRLRAGTGEFVVLRDPELIWRVLVTDAGSFTQGKWKRRARRFLGPTLNTLNGEEHKQRRLLLQPALDRRRIAGFDSAIAAHVDRMQRAWQDGTRIRLRDELDPLSLTVAAEVLLSTDLSPRAVELARALNQVIAGVPQLRGPLPGTRQQRALVTIGAEVRACITERRGALELGDDLLGLLLRSGLPDSTIRGEVTAFLLAAVDEPPSALAAAFYLLGQDEEVERRFHDELDRVLGDRLPGLDDEDQLPYLDAVLRETLRLYPPARHIDRCPIGTAEIAGAEVGTHTNVLVSPLVTHHDERLHDHPSEFAPQRWLDKAANGRPQRAAYFPFGAGAHTCIGEPLARAIMVLTLARIGQGWRLRVDEGAHAPVPRARPMIVTLERR